MPSIQIKDVPAETHAVLRRRAAAAGQSMQEFLRSMLINLATSPTLNEVLDSVESAEGGSATFEEVTALIRADRDRR